MAAVIIAGSDPAAGVPVDLQVVRYPVTTTTVPVTTTTVPATTTTSVPVVHHALPITGAPALLEFGISFGLLAAGLVAVAAARRESRRRLAGEVSAGGPASG